MDKYGYNNIFVDEKVNLTERQLRNVNGQVSEAKQLLEIAEYCDAKVIITDMRDRLASYNPRTNVLQISARMTSDSDILMLQEGFASQKDTRSTMVHEFFHWKDADEYRKKIGNIESADPKSNYSVYQREEAARRLKQNGVDLNNGEQIREISTYAYKKSLVNNFEEVYTEYRTKKLLEG